MNFFNTVQIHAIRSEKKQLIFKEHHQISSTIDFFYKQLVYKRLYLIL